MADHLSVLNQTLIFLQGFQQAETLMWESLALIAKLTGWQGLALVVPGETHGVVRVEAAAGTLAALRGETSALDADAIAAVARDKSMLCLPDATTDGGVLLAPLRRGELVHLCLYVVDDTPDFCNADTRSLVETLAEMLSLALQKARLYETLQYEVSERQHIEDRYWAATHKMETLYRVSRSLIGPQHLDDILETVITNIAGALRADRVVLIRGNPATCRHCDILVSAADDSLPSLRLEYLMAGAAGTAIRDGLPVFVTRAAVHSWTATSRETLYDDGMDGSIAAAPLFLHGQAVGALLALNRLDQRDFTQQDVDLLMATSAQIVAAMRNARLFQEVAEERERLGAVVNSSRDGVMLLDHDLRLLVVNKTALRLLGILGEPEAWVNRSAWHVINVFRDHSPHAVRAALAEMRRVRSGDDQLYEDEVKIGLRIIRWMSLPVRSPEQTLGRLVVFRDVTEERMLEQFRDDLTHTMVHDLRNPLSGIHAALSLLMRSASERLTAAQQEVLDIAFKSTQRMLKLVNAILDISRLETGQMLLSPSVFRFSDMVNELVEYERPLIEESHLNLVNAVGKDVPLVWADRELVERVMQNLLGNAVKFTPSGGEVRVAAEVEQTFPNKLRISIADTGSGIPPEIRATLFTKFVTGPQQARGNGLGLAFCRMVLEAHGERIWVSSTSESGTTFTFTLPLASRARV